MFAIRVAALFKPFAYRVRIVLAQTLVAVSPPPGRTKVARTASFGLNGWLEDDLWDAAQQVLNI